MTIRDAIVADLPAIVAIYNASIPGRAATADTQPVTVASRRDWFHEHNPNARPLWVAVQNDIIAGWLSFQSFYGRPAYHATAELSVYIAPNWQRKGIGNALLSQAVVQAPRLGVENSPRFHLRPQRREPAAIREIRLSPLGRFAARRRAGRRGARSDNCWAACRSKAWNGNSRCVKNLTSSRSRFYEKNHPRNRIRVETTDS